MTTNYNSLGQMLAKHDFETLFNKLSTYKDKDEDFEIITEIVKGKSTSIVDDILFNMPKFIENKETKELHPFVLETVDLLLSYGANPNAVYDNGVTPFLLFSSVNNVDLLKKLIENPYREVNELKGTVVEKKANVNQLDGRGCKAIFYAAITSSLDVMDFLVKECNANLNEQNIFLENKTILHFLAQNISIEAVVETGGLDYLEDLDLVKIEAIEKALELGADPRIRDYNESLPEEIVPMVEDYPLGEVPPETEEGWNNAYEKIGHARLKLEEEKKTTKTKIVI